MKSRLLDEIVVRGTRFRNRLWVPPMCQYVADDGAPTDWHFGHYAGLASSTGAVIVEATAISRIGRVTPQDLLLESEAQLAPFAHLCKQIASRGAIPGIQLSHSGRKGSRTRPWDGDRAISPTEGGWELVSASPLAFGRGYAEPTEMSQEDVETVVQQFVTSARLAWRAGYRLVEVHAGHGRLVHSFLSAVANQRHDAFGGTLANRARFAQLIAQAIRQELPDVVLSFRLSCVDWCEGGLTIDDSIAIARILKQSGVDLINCSSGGIIRPLEKPTGPGYQVPFATKIGREAAIATAAVGLIRDLDHAEEIVSGGLADVVLMGRFLLLDPLAPLRHAAARGRVDLIPRPYQRAATRESSSDIKDHVPEL